MEQWRDEMAKGGLQWIEHRLVPYRLEFDWWVQQAGCADSAIAALIKHAAQAPLGCVIRCNWSLTRLAEW
jgi:hypothetical protein